jgi:hypothetical protein
MIVDYEKLGSFYVGKEYDLAAAQLKDNLVLYDSKDLVTHAVIIGMTGSGKTGLGIGLLEEALMDNIPFIAIDPKGDLGNILLTFPELNAANFRPWINEQEAAIQGQTPEQFAETQAQLWQKGLGEWGQTAERIAKLRQSVDFAIYTPGSSSGLQVSVLRSFAVPAQAVLSDSDALREHIQTTATSLLALMGLEADPMTSREHVLVSNILSRSWSEGKSLDIASLIKAIQEPPFTQIGVMDIESFYPQKDRLALSMQLNNLLASPGFSAWMEGEPLDIQRMFYTPEGKARACIFTISHLGDKERMFFVSMLLNEVLGWMRTQSGTTSLRAMLYMDEIFGYLPPTASPPSKVPMLTLLKQARAFGLGLVLATQNPVDLDYKALSNTGTWFIGRLQTERDKARVLEGLEGASQAGFDRAEMDKILSGLGKRVFLMHNVNDNAPTIFQTRWAMSYLRGPLTKEQIKSLMSERKTATLPLASPASTAQPSAVQAAFTPAASSGVAPATPQGVKVYYLPASGEVTYSPAVLSMVEANYNSAKHNINQSAFYALACELEDGPVPCNWENAVELSIAPQDLQIEPLSSATFADLPKDITSKNLDKWQKDALLFIRQQRPITLYSNKEYRLVSRPGESEGDFRARLGQSSREGRDSQVEKLRAKYASKLSTLQNRLQNAMDRVGREQSRARQQQLDTAINIGTTVLGALMGRKKLSVTNARGVGSVLKSGSRAQRQGAQVAKAEESVETIQQQITELETQLQGDIEQLSGGLDTGTLALETIEISAKPADLSVKVFGLVWLPYAKDSEGRLSPAWR